MNWLRLALLLPFLVACADEPKTVAENTAPEKDGPYLWEATSEFGRAYLMGTIHVPDKRVLDLPVVVRDAFAKSDVVLTELLLDAEVQVRVQNLMFLPKGERMRDLIPKDRYEKMSRVVPLAGVDQMKIWAATVSLMIIHARDQFLSGRKPMDLSFPIDAKALGKEVGALEEAEEQIAAFETLTIEEQTIMLEQMIELIAKDRKNGTNFIDALVDVYLSGNLEKMMTHAVTFGAEPTDFDRKVMKAMLDDRNVVMADRLVERMKAKRGKTWFVAVGAGHHWGPKGLPVLLRNKGFKVRRVPGSFPAAPSSSDPSPSDPITD